jgi:hypothetical protein
MIGLIVIPARKNSKRLKEKNKKIFLNKTLIQHSIDFAKKIKITPFILLTTDDKEILNIGFKSKILTPWLRPKNLSGDKSKSISFMFHAINWFENTFTKLDYVILLQPTSPFRYVKTIKEMFKLFKKNKHSVVTFNKNIKNEKKIYYIKNKNKIFFENKKGIKCNVCGSIYINSIKNLRKYKSFVNKKTIPYILKNNKETVDIDTVEDFSLAQKLSYDVKSKKLV